MYMYYTKQQIIKVITWATIKLGIYILYMYDSSPVELTENID